MATIRPVEVAAMVVGVGLLAYVGGLISANVNLAPYQMVKEADRAASDWRQNWRSYLGLRAMYLKPASRNAASGVTVNDPAAFPGYTFVTTMFADGFYPALMDMQGKVVHRWKIAYSDAFPDPPQLDYDVDDLDTVVHGAEVFPDGSVLLNWSGYGLAKLDRCAKVEWSIPRITHHAVDVLPNGEILTLSRTFATEKEFRPGMTMPDRGYIWRDEIMRISADGKILEELPVWDLFYNNGREALLSRIMTQSTQWQNVVDPLHTNDIEVLTEQMAPAFPMFTAGDVILSFRALNMLMVIDSTLKKVKWLQQGPYIRQHDPDFMPNGHILVFDNRDGGIDRVWGYSRVMEMDPATGNVVWQYQGTDEAPFYTRSRGRSALLPNGNVLVSEFNRGRVFEVTRPDNKIVWDWTNSPEPGLIGLVTQAERIPLEAATFVGQSCP
jgi:hypothetical protein